MIQRQGVLDRTLFNLRQVWRSLSQPPVNGRPGPLVVRADLPDKDLAVMREQLRACLAGRGGVVSANAQAAVVGETYLGLNAQGKGRFLRLLAEDFAVDHQALADVIQAYDREADEVQALQFQAELRALLRAPRRRILTQFNALPQGVRFLVDLRRELRELTDGNPQMHAMDTDLKELLASWFDIGFLDLQRLAW